MKRLSLVGAASLPTAVTFRHSNCGMSSSVLRQHTLRVMANKVYNSPPSTPTASHRSCCWSTSSRPNSSTSHTSILDTISVTKSAFDQAEDFYLHKPALLHALPDELRIQLATRPASDISSNAISLDIHPPAEEPSTFHLEYCFEIIKALKTPFLDVLVSQ